MNVPLPLSHPASLFVGSLLVLGTGWLSRSTVPLDTRRPYPQSEKTAVALPGDSARLYLPDDLEALVWAESPQLYNPTNMDVDARGRIWVTEAVNYRKFANKAETRLDHPDGERIVILEDTDQDGKANK